MTNAWDLYEVARDLYITAMRFSRYYLYGEFDPDRANAQLRAVIEFAVMKGITISYTVFIDRLDQAVEYQDFMSIASDMFAELEHIMRTVELSEEVKERFKKLKEDTKEVFEKTAKGEIMPEEIEEKDQKVSEEGKKAKLMPAGLISIDRRRYIPIKNEKKEEKKPIAIIPTKPEIPIVQDIKGVFNRMRDMGLWDEKLRNRALDVLWNRLIEYFGMRDGFHVYIVEGQAERNYFVYIPHYNDILNNIEVVKDSACTCKDFEMRALRENRFCKHILAVLIQIFLDKAKRNAQDKIQAIYNKTKEEVIPYTRIHK